MSATVQLIKPLSAPPPSDIFVHHGYGQVGTGKTPEAARADLLERIRQAREA